MKKRSRLVKIVGTLSLGGLVTLVACQSDDSGAADEEGVTTSTEPGDDGADGTSCSSCGGEGSCGGE
jgi:hypothetical protein